MTTYAVYLRPRGALASPISSETLFGAVCWGLHLLGQDVGALLQHFTPARFVFSSTFPVVLGEGTDRLRFYPRPVTLEATPSVVRRAAERLAQKTHAPLKAAQVEVAETLKRDLKSVTYLSEKTLARIAGGTLTAEQWLTVVLDKSKDLVRVGNLLMTGEEAARWPKTTSRVTPLSRSTPRLHNQIDRVAGATVDGMLFYENEVRFAPGAGLWAVLRAEAKDIETLIRPALRYLQDTGFGANRGVGQGQFDISLEPLTTLPDGGPTANGFMTLSRYLPAAGEVIAGEPLAYKLITLRGKRESKFPQPDDGTATPAIYKRALRVFEPGSVFPLKARHEVYGALAEAIPASNQAGATYQSGLTLPVFMRVSREE